MNTVRCPNCNRELIAEEVPTHKCKAQLGNVTQVVDKVYDWWTTSDLPRYGRVLIVKTKDGTLYRMKPSDETLQGRKGNDSDEDLPAPFPGFIRPRPRPVP
jgi:hypothetical protein